jgi:hypothetical protein
VLWPKIDRVVSDFSHAEIPELSGPFQRRLTLASPKLSEPKASGRS